MELLKPTPIKEFDEYLQKLLLDINLDKEEKRELEEEWKQHFYDHLAALEKQNINKEEAIRTVLEQFGDIGTLQKEVNETYPGSIKRHIQKEIFIAIICMVASVIGPMILIGAHFRSYLIMAPIQALILAYVIYRFVVNRQVHWLISIIGFFSIYLFFIIGIFPMLIGIPISLDVYTNHLFSLQWDRLTGLNGLFEIVTIHMMWYVVISFQILSNKNYIPTWKKIMNASFHYWAMLLIAILFALFQSSAEWGVLYLNVFLLYTFLQLTISIDRVCVIKEKISRLLIKQKI